MIALQKVKSSVGHQRLSVWANAPRQGNKGLAMTSVTLTASTSFNYKKVRPFSAAEFKFKSNLAHFASERLLPKLRARNSRDLDRNRYTGISVRLANAIYLEAVLINETAWGGFGFDFARLLPANDKLYNLSLRRLEDWEKAECDPVALASEYFMGRAFCPRATDWIQIARGRTFEECIDVLVDEPSF